MALALIARESTLNMDCSMSQASKHLTVCLNDEHTINKLRKYPFPTSPKPKLASHASIEVIAKEERGKIIER